MEANLDVLEKMDYPGRVIILGKSPNENDVAMYAITGRSPSSQARKLEYDETEKILTVKPTEEKTLKTGNPDLLIYPAIMIKDGIAVSNGKQTSDILPEFNLASRLEAVQVLVASMKKWSFEDDGPIFTPRISGCIYNGYALSMIKRSASGSAEKHFFEFSPAPGSGKMIATYQGINADPLPSFSGEPYDIEIPFKNPDKACEALYNALGPKQGGNDFRVACACVFHSLKGTVKIAVKNKN